ncbi:MAG: methyltransferase domain-containing protein [Gemmatimonadetes bacterium]|nr:methyltransferase domain-containing protein [Gemmatimonadota bacterium]
MQTPAERRLVEHLARVLPYRDAAPALVLAVGAGRSLSIENQLSAAGRSFLCDRVDVEDCRLEDPRVRNAWICSAEDMPSVSSAAYDAAFANYVLEHVPNVRRAAREIFRVLKPGGLFVTSFPNPRAFEFVVARRTPLAFHEWVRGREAWETHYDYGSVEGLVARFEEAGFHTLDVDRRAFLEGYLHRFGPLGALARGLDGAADRGGWRGLQGNVAAAFRRPPAS